MNLDSRQKIVATLAVIVAVMMVGSYVFVLSTEAEEYEGAVDAMGNRLTFDSVPDTIVSTAPSVTESIHALGYESKLVGVSQNCDYPQSVSDRIDDEELKAVGPYNKPNKEEIMDLEADVVFITNTADGTEVYNHLKNAEEKVVLLHQEETIQDIYLNLIVIAKSMQDEDSTADVQQDMAQTFNEVSERAADGGNPKVMLNLGFGWGMESVFSFGSNTFGDDVVQMVNGTNAVEASGFNVITEEMLGTDKGNPDIIIAMVQDVEFTQSDYDYYMSQLQGDPMWSNTTAVQNEDVYFFYDRAASISQRASVDLTDFAMLSLMYTQPQLFEDFTPPKYIGNDYADLFDGHW